MSQMNIEPKKSKRLSPDVKKLLTCNSDEFIDYSDDESESEMSDE